MARNLTLDITARDKTGRAFKSVKNNIQGLSKRLGGMKALLGAAFGAAAITSLVRLANEARSTADEIGKVSKTIGITAETLQEFRFAADLAGVSNETLDKGFQKFTRTIGELRAGTGALTTFLNKFDAQLASNLKGVKTTDEALAIFFRRLEETSGAADRAALAAAAFGRAGVQMVNMVENGARSIDDMRQKLRDLNGVMSNEVIKNAEEMNDKFTEMDRVIDSQLTIALLDLMGPLLVLKGIFADLVTGISSFINRFKELRNLSLTGLEQRLARLKILQREANMGASVLTGDGGAAKIARINALILAKKKLVVIPPATVGGVGVEGAQTKKDETIVRFVRGVVEQLNKENEARNDAIALLKFHNFQQSQLLAAKKRSEKAAKSLKIAIETENEAMRLGIKFGTAQGQAFAEAFRESKRLEGAMGDLARAQESAKQFAQDLGGAFSDFLGDAIAGVGSLKDALKSLAAKALSIVGNKLLEGVFSSGGSIAPSTSSFFNSIGKMLGFQHGGSFKVGGSGGADSQVVAFRASPNETVSISRPGQRTGGGGSVVLNIDARGAEVGVEDRIRAVLSVERPGIIAEAVRESQGRVEHMAGLGGSFARAVGRR